MKRKPDYHDHILYKTLLLTNKHPEIETLSMISGNKTSGIETQS
ncbi:MAG: hypothetical protein ABFD21_07895 [Anaerolineaceae bacterium]